METNSTIIHGLKVPAVRIKAAERIATVNIHIIIIATSKFLNKFIFISAILPLKSNIDNMNIKGL